jgi:stage III sporulation protein AA
LSPEVIIVDEIGREEDAMAIHEALHAGIRVIASAHGQDLDDIRRRPVMRTLIENKVFSRYITMHSEAGIPAVHSIYDSCGNRIQW